MTDKVIQSWIDGPLSAQRQPFLQPHHSPPRRSSPSPHGSASSVDGQNVKVELRWAEGNPDRLPVLIAEFVQAKVDVIVVSGPAAIGAAQRATGTIPIVFVVLIDPVTMGFARSLARPGGNMTGVGSHFEELITKQLQLLVEAVPKLSKVAFLRRPESAKAILTAAQSAARSLGLTVRTLEFAGPAELEDAVKVAHNERVGAVHALPSPYLGGALGARLIELAARYRLPACYELRSYVLRGGLHVLRPEHRRDVRARGELRRSSSEGANPGHLPIERPSRSDLVIKLRTAAALGLTLSQSLR